LFREEQARLAMERHAGLTACIGGHGLASQRAGSHRWYSDPRTRRLLGSVMRELVPLSAAVDLVNVGHDETFQRRCGTGRPAVVAEPAGTAVCPW
jgi:hypothetical protein